MPNLTPLIPIATNLINHEEVNSVNARELHIALELKKDFSHWIKNQINRAELVENVDYLTHALKGVGGKFDKIDYILTLDSAKHIAMMSQSKKAKEVRNYFIEVEKEYIASLKQKALNSNAPISLGLSLTDELLNRNDYFLACGIIPMKLTVNEIRVLSTLIKLQNDASQKYLIVTDAHIAKGASLPHKSVTNTLSRLDEKGVVKKMHKRNHQGLMERRIFISERLLAELNFEPKSQSTNVAPPPSLPKIITPSEPTQNIAELENMINRTITKAIAPLREEIEELRRAGRKAQNKESRIKALNHAIHMAKQQMIDEPHLTKECLETINNGLIHLEYLETHA